MIWYHIHTLYQKQYFSSFKGNCDGWRERYLGKKGEGVDAEKYGMII
jgi:hypothetical protein